jgi:hypothetical protein
LLKVIVVQDQFLSDAVHRRPATSRVILMVVNMTLKDVSRTLMDVNTTLKDVSTILTDVVSTSPTIGPD